MKPKVRHRQYRREAMLMLILARLAVRVLPAEWILAWARHAPHRLMRFRVSEAAEWVRWAIESAGQSGIAKANCLPRALAAQAMLRRRGVPSRLCLGVAREGEALSAHAWLELGQQIVVGGAEAPQFTRLVKFGGERV